MKAENSGINFSGCNAWANYDADRKFDGTMTSMHDCSDCHRLEYCLIKQTTEVFVKPEDYDALWKQTLELETEFEDA